MGTFEFKDEEDLVIKQIKHNCNFWSSDVCKRATLEKYCRAKGVQDPKAVIDQLISRGVVWTPKKGYVGLVK